MGFVRVNLQKAGENQAEIRSCRIELGDALEDLQYKTNGLVVCASELAQQSGLLREEKGPLNKWMRRNLDPEFSTLLKQLHVIEPHIASALAKNDDLQKKIVDYVEAYPGMARNILNTKNALRASMGELAKPRLSRESRDSQRSVVTKAKDLAEQLLRGEFGAHMISVNALTQNCTAQIQHNLQLLASDPGLRALRHKSL